MKLESTTLFGNKIYFRPNTPDVHMVHASGNDDLAVASEIFAKISAKKLILDLGAYIGTTSIFFANSIKDSLTISLEPSPDNYRILKLNTLRYKNIVPIHAAVGPKTTKSNIYNRHTGEWGHTLYSNPEDCENPTFIANIDVLTINDILNKFKQNSYTPSILKIDIEGYEHELLKDPQYLSAWPIIIIELHERIKSGCIELWNNFVTNSSHIEIYVDHEKRICADSELLVKLCRQS